MQPTSVAAGPPAPAPAYERVKPPRLYLAAAWVVIVAGIVFILSTIFFAGAMIVGFNHHCHYKHHHGMMYGPDGPGGPGGPRAAWQFGGPAGPGMVVGPWGPPPGFGPGGPGGPFGPPPPGPGGPGGPSQSPTPSPPAPAPNTPGNPRP